jgi:hypothetical protein
MVKGEACVEDGSAANDMGDLPMTLTFRHVTDRPHLPVEFPSLEIQREQLRRQIAAAPVQQGWLRWRGWLRTRTQIPQFHPLGMKKDRRMAMG